MVHENLNLPFPMGIETILIVLGVTSLIIIAASWGRGRKRATGPHAYNSDPNSGPHP